MKMQRLWLKTLSDEVRLKYNPTLLYVKELIDNASTLENEKYYVNSYMHCLAVEGNYSIICSFVWAARRMFIKKGTSYNVMFVESPRPGDMTCFSRLWIKLSPDPLQNRLIFRTHTIVTDNINDALVDLS